MLKACALMLGTQSATVASAAQAANRTRRGAIARDRMAERPPVW
jgi:hypothetical protein